MPKFKLKRRTIASSPNDPFAHFREIALLELQQQFNYRHSFGKTSQFFLGLKQGKLLATKCKACGTVYMPPRAVCPKELNITEWLELSGKGTLESWTLCSHAPAYAHTEEPYVLAYVSLEGADTLFLHQLRNIEPSKLTHKLGIHVVFADEAVHHPLAHFWFEPTLV